jgi:hypothetical protein
VADPLTFHDLDSDMLLLLVDAATSAGFMIYQALGTGGRWYKVWVKRPGDDRSARMVTADNPRRMNQRLQELFDHIERYDND